MTPEHRATSEPVEAAVLVPLFAAPGGRLRLALIRRSEAGPHPGEIGLPGGKREPRDRSLLDTAVRETGEEIGLARGEVEVLEALPPVHTLTSGFVIHPFLARVRRPARWRVEAAEVAEVIELAVADLARPAARTREAIAYPGRAAPIEADCLRVGDVRIWGATYRILAPLVERLGPDPVPPWESGGGGE
jgi:8-oxo-dGTP pyrophosphatase MutT (NUDIX family)